MVRNATSLIKSCAALAALALQGCVTIQAIEPVIEPPHVFMGDVAVAVEFASPGMIGFRCAERGVTFLGLPGLNAGACADRTLVTMVDPCQTVTAGGYAAALCSGVAWRKLEAGAQPAPPPQAGAVLIKASFGATGPALRGRAPAATTVQAGLPQAHVEFVAADALEMRCAERGAKMFDAGSARACADRFMVTALNPCDPAAAGWYAHTLCHELAHVNGWPADHPTGERVRGPFRMASESPQAIALAAAQKAKAETQAISAPAPTALTAEQQVEVAARFTDFAQALRLDRIRHMAQAWWTSLAHSRASLIPAAPATGGKGWSAGLAATAATAQDTSR